MRIDSKIRQIDDDACVTYLQSLVLSSGSQPSSPSYPKLPQMEALMKGYVCGLKNLALMTLHKTYFSYAVLRPHEEPLGPKWAPSTNAMYESANMTLESAHSITRNLPNLQTKIGPNWMNYHSAVVSFLTSNFTITYNRMQLVLYGFCIYIPYSHHAAEAMKTADAAIAGVFQVHMGESPYAASSLVSILDCSLFRLSQFQQPGLLRAQAEAKTSMARYQAGTWIHPADSPVTPTPKLNEDEMST
jgi:hypothetical protein